MTRLTKVYKYNEPLTHKGETRTISEWADHLKIPAGTIYNRRQRGGTAEECLRVGRQRGYEQPRTHPWKARPI